VTEAILGAFLILLMRMSDVTIGTFRTILVVQAHKYYAAVAGFFEVLIWIYAMRYIINHMDNSANLLAYAGGFALGNLLGITLEGKIALGYLQLNVVSKSLSEKIAEHLRGSMYNVVLLPVAGDPMGMSVLVAIIRRRDQKNVIRLIEEIDPDCFISLQHSRPYRGFIHGSRK